MKKSRILALALVGTMAAGTTAAYAQTYPMSPPKGPVHIDQDGYLRDSAGNIIDRNANRVIGSNTARPGPGDYGMPPAAHERRGLYNNTLPPYSGGQAIMTPSTDPSATSPNAAMYTDEYGHKYNYRGDRLDSAGNIISPHTRGNP